MERLDRFLCNPEWQQMFKEANVLHLPRTSSNHYPILLNSCPEPHSFGYHSFRLETMWFSDPSFPTLVKDSWSLFPHNVSLALEDFTHRVSFWNKHHLGNIFHKKKRLLARINGIQKAQSSHPTLSLSNLERDLSTQYQKVLLEEEFWALKAKLEWSTLGDCNTTFFHLSVIYK
jgi:hypothetical protein